MSAAETFWVHPRAEARAIGEPTPRIASRASASALTLSINHDLVALEHDWRAFERVADCTVFQCFDWLSAWQDNIGAITKVTPAIVCARDASGALVMMLPFAVYHTRLARELRFHGGTICDYNGPLLSRDFTSRFGDQFLQTWDDIRAQLQRDPRSRHDLVILDKLPETIGAQPNPFLQLQTTLNPSGAYAVSLGDDWETFYTSARSSGTRRNDRTKRKRLSAVGEVRCVAGVSSAERLENLNTLIVQKSRAFARMGVPNIFEPPGHRKFYLDAVNRAGLDVHISTLKVGDFPAAHNFALLFRGRYHHVLSSYDDGPLSRNGPGIAHLHELMKYAIAHRCGVFDFTIGDEPYKREWADQVISLYDHVAPASARGVAIAAVTSTLRKLKRQIKQSKVLWPAMVRARAAIARITGRNRPAKNETSPTDGAE